MLKTVNYLNNQIVLNSMNNKNIKKIRTITINDRGQIVIPEEMRKDFNIKKSSTLVLVEGTNGILIRKEEDVISEIEDEKQFWSELTKHSMQRAWFKEDEIWDKVYKEKK